MKGRLTWASTHATGQDGLGFFLGVGYSSSYILAMETRSWWPGIRATRGIWHVAVVMACLTHMVSGEVLRLSKVVAEGSANAERIELNHGNEREVLFVEKQPIVTRADVKSAMRSPQQEDALAITLTEEGGKKLGAATKDAHGDMRIAVLIDEKVVLAPVVNQQLGNQFVIEGLKEYPGDDLDFLVWRIEGKSDEEIAKLLWERRQAAIMPPPPRPEPEYYSDEEYAALKKEREKRGMFYLDELPTEEELNKRIKAGMSSADVVNELGRATHATLDGDQRVTDLHYKLAPERRSLSIKMRPNGFAVHFSKGEMVSWGIETSDAPREGKPPKGGRRALNAVFPKADFARKDFDMVRWVEEIQILPKEGEKTATPQDYADLISLVHSCAAAAKESALIEADCSMVKTLAEGFPEVEELRKASNEGKISLMKLRDLLKPYLLGEKPFPGSSGAP